MLVGLQTNHISTLSQYQRFRLGTRESMFIPRKHRARLGGRSQDCQYLLAHATTVVRTLDATGPLRLLRGEPPTHREQADNTTVLHRRWRAAWRHPRTSEPLRCLL